MRLFYLLLFCATLAFSHNLKHEIAKADSFVLSFSFVKKGDFSFKDYEVFAPDSKIVFAKGKTDALSRVIFLPNQKGIWRVKVFSKDGHGTIVDVEVDEQLKSIKEDDNDGSLSFLEELIGLLVLLGIFGLIYMRKDKENPDVR